MSRRPLAAVTGAALAMIALSACTSTAPQGGGEGGPIQVTASDTTCDISASEAPAGNVAFSIQNTGYEGHRVLRLRHGRPDRRRGREHRPRPLPPAAGRGAPGRPVHDRLQAGHGRRRHPRAVQRHRQRGGGDVPGRRARRGGRPATSATRTPRSRPGSPRPRSSSTRSSGATSLLPRRSSRSRAPTGSASSRWRSRSATSTRASTVARTTSATRASRGPGTTASRRTCGSPACSPTRPRSATS